MTATQPKTRVPCTACNGDGVVPRQTDLHLSNTAPKECCSKCGGNGKEPLSPARVKEPSAVALLNPSITPWHDHSCGPMLPLDPGYRQAQIDEMRVEADGIIIGRHHGGWYFEYIIAQGKRNG